MNQVNVKADFKQQVFDWFLKPVLSETVRKSCSGVVITGKRPGK